MKSDPSILERLDAPTKAPYWPVAAEGNFYLNFGLFGRMSSFWLVNLELYLKSETTGDRPPAKIPVPVPQSYASRTDEVCM